MSRITDKFVTLLGALAVTLLASPSAIADDADAELELVRQRVGEMFEMIEPDDVSRSPVPGWYTIHKEHIVAYISADGRYLLQGDLIDLDMGANLTEQLRNETRRNLLANVADDHTIVFAPDDVKYKVSVFTDVDCTYCRRLHSQIDAYMEKGIEVRYFLYPRNGPASHAWNTMEDVWCAADRQNALTMAKLDREFPTSKCDASMVQEHYVLGREVGLTGTPAIILDDGSLISGYLPPDQLAATLQQKAR